MAQLSPSVSRYFNPNPPQLAVATRLYATVKDLPLICPHGHVDPRLFADPDYTLWLAHGAADRPRSLYFSYAPLPGHFS